jgi:hypothetical protein
LVEWKSQIDLTDAEWKFRCGKSILGLGNRDPAFARNRADGCSYFIAGASQVPPGDDWEGRTA